MARVVRPMLDRGYFESVTMDRNRLYAQILDSLNKSAAVGFPYTEIGARLDSAWVGEPGQRRIYADAQECATQFRDVLPPAQLAGLLAPVGALLGPTCGLTRSSTSIC